MGISNPRPAMRRRERKRTEAALRDHADFMSRFQAQGMTREEASREALRMVRAGIPVDAQEDDRDS